MDGSQNVQFSFGAELPSDLPYQRTPTGRSWSYLTGIMIRQSKIKHTKVAGTDAKLGFGQCALPLILEHNTPNNSIALIWADTPGEHDRRHAMRPLFRRRQRAHLRERTKWTIHFTAGQLNS